MPKATGYGYRPMGIAGNYYASLLERNVQRFGDKACLFVPFILFGGKGLLCLQISEEVDTRLSKPPC